MKVLISGINGFLGTPARHSQGRLPCLCPKRRLDTSLQSRFPIAGFHARSAGLWTNDPTMTSWPVSPGNMLGYMAGSPLGEIPRK
jgi:hypothetical protein